MKPDRTRSISCPRSGCGTTTKLKAGGKLETHKLPDGWRTCAASGGTLDEARALGKPTNVTRSYLNQFE